MEKEHTLKLDGLKDLRSNLVPPVNQKRLAKKQAAVCKSGDNAMTIEEKKHLDFEVYQRNRRQMCWGAMSMMLFCTAATILEPERMAAAESILMAQYLALSALVGAYFAVGHKEA